jgi:hypothetical protein
MTTQETIRAAGPKYLALQRALSESEWSVSALPQITKRLSNAEVSVKQTQDNIRKFDKRSKDQLERLQHLRHGGVKRAWYRTQGKLEEKLKEEEKDWLREFELVQAAKAKGEEQQKEVEEARRLSDQVIHAKHVYERSQQELNNLLNELFDGPTPSYPSEDEIEQSLVSIRQRADNISVLAKRQAFVLKTLQRAHECLVASLQNLQSSLQMNTYDMFTHGGYADWMVHSSLAQARDLAARAQYLVTEVRRIEPNVPHLGDIQIEQDNLVFNIIFDNIFTDLRVRQIIQESTQKVYRATTILEQQVLPGQVSKTQAAEAQIESCQTEVRKLEQAMWNERSRIMTEVIRGSQEPPPPPIDEPETHIHSQNPFRDAPSESGRRSPTLYVPPPPPIEPLQRSDTAETIDEEPPPPYSIEEAASRRARR